MSTTSTDASQSLSARPEAGQAAALGCPQARAGMLAETWRWRSQIFQLAKTEITKTSRGAVLGWVWLFVKPAVYIGVFWFALELGLRAGNASGGAPFIMWLCCGLVPWFFMSDMIGGGSNVYRRYSYLVNKIRFPLPAISAFYALSKFFVYLASMALVLAVYALLGGKVGWQWLQLLAVAPVMYVFFVLWSVMTSPLSALSKDFANLIKTLSTPIFWLSGIIFDVSSLQFDWIRTVLAFNPVTFFAEAHRLAVCQNEWLWDYPWLWGPMLAVFAATALAAWAIQRRVGKDVADVL